MVLELYNLSHSSVKIFSQAIWRYVSVHVGSPMYAYNPKFNGITWMVFSLPFVQLNQIHESIALIRREFEGMNKRKIRDYLIG